MNREASDLDVVKPMLLMKAEKRWFQARGACLSPY